MGHHRGYYLKDYLAYNPPSIDALSHQLILLAAPAEAGNRYDFPPLTRPGDKPYPASFVGRYFYENPTSFVRRYFYENPALFYMLALL